MAFCRVLLPLLVVSVVQSYASVEVPVFLWGDLAQYNSKHSALTAVPSNEFRTILKQELYKEPFVVVFIEETLSVEDFSSKLDGVSTLSYLEANVRNSLYLPSVESPVRTLNKIAAPDMVDHVKLTDSGLSADINRAGEKKEFLFINLKDAKEGETREQLLHRHNDFMEDVFTKLQERYERVVAVYTAHYPSWTVVEHSRVRRQAEAQAQGNPAVTDLSLNGFRIYFQMARLNDTVLTGALPGDSKINDTESASTIIFGENSVTFNAASRAGYWFIDSVRLVTPSIVEELYPSQDLFALLDFSYRCAVNVTFAGTYTSFSLQNMRAQVYFTPNNTGLEFGDMFNCVGFFTVPIWAGLFVVAIMLAITFYGFMMMMDIKTMDRFDDPKGKTIAVVAAE